MSTGKVRTHRSRAHERGNLLVQYKGDYDNEIQAGYVEIQYNPEVATPHAQYCRVFVLATVGCGQDAALHHRLLNNLAVATATGHRLPAGAEDAPGQRPQQRVCGGQDPHFW